MGRLVEIITLLSLIILLGVVSWLLYDNLPREAVPFESHVLNASQINYTSSTQFYPNMRFRESRISYDIESGCSDVKRSSALETFALLEEETVLSFYESATPEIMVICSQLPPESQRKKHFVAGEGGPTEILNGSLYSIIVRGTFSLYRDETCDEAHIALHETLHVLGFDHNTNPSSILYPTLDCNQELDGYLIDEINRLYAVSSQPDLLVFAASGNKSGKYASFEIQIANQGLKDAQETSLRVYADERLVKDFALDTVPIAARKILTVTNLNVGRRTERIEFRIDEDNRIAELDDTNNNQELILKRD